jgi:hypothetical protein
MLRPRKIYNTDLCILAAAICGLGIGSCGRVHCIAAPAAEASYDLPKASCLIHGVETTSAKWVVEYDYKTRNPRWAFEFITREGHNSKESNRKHSKFFAENSVDADDFKVGTRLRPVQH